MYVCFVLVKCWCGAWWCPLLCRARVNQSTRQGTASARGRAGGVWMRVFASSCPFSPSRSEKWKWSVSRVWGSWSGGHALRRASQVSASSLSKMAWQAEVFTFHFIEFCPSSCCLLSPEMRNMFNIISRQSLLPFPIANTINTINVVVVVSFVLAATYEVTLDAPGMRCCCCCCLEPEGFPFCTIRTFFHYQTVVVSDNFEAIFSVLYSSLLSHLVFSCVYTRVLQTPLHCQFIRALWDSHGRIFQFSALTINLVDVFFLGLVRYTTCLTWGESFVMATNDFSFNSFFSMIYWFIFLNNESAGRGCKSRPRLRHHHRHQQWGEAWETRM